jgi:uncharacterized protein (DUF2384 family)
MNPVTAARPATPSRAVPDAELDAMLRVFGITQTDLARMLGTTPRTVSRWRTTSSVHSDPRPSAARSLRELARLRWLLESDLGEQGARQWLRTPNPTLEGQAPLSVMLDGDWEEILALVLALGQGGLY